MKMKKLKLGAAVLALSIVATVANIQPVQADPILGLFNTGVDGAGVPIAPFSAGADTHYTLLGPDFPLGPANVINNNPVWFVAPAGSEWIGRADGSGGNTPSANYIFTTTFDLTGLDFTTASITGRIGSDDAASIFLNGVDSGFSGSNFASLTNFVLNSDFVPGLNVLEFVVLNSTFTGVNPMGLVITDLAGTADIVSRDPIPEPGTLALFGLGLAGLGFARRKKTV